MKGEMVMTIFFDVLIVAVFLFATIKYWHKGLIQAVLGFGKFIAAVIAAAVLGRPIALWINDTFMSKWISDGVYSKISTYIIDGQSLSEFFNGIPEGFRKIVELCGGEMAALFEKYGSEEASSELIYDMATTISAPLANAASAIIAYGLIFLVSLLVFSLVCLMFKKIEIPIISKIDKLLGLCLGLILGILGAAIIATVGHTILEFISATSGNLEIIDWYNNSYVFKFVNELKIFSFIRSLI